MIKTKNAGQNAYDLVSHGPTLASGGVAIKSMAWRGLTVKVGGRLYDFSFQPSYSSEALLIFADRFALIRPGFIGENGKKKPLDTRISWIVKCSLDD